MITKERLEELEGKSATIYSAAFGYVSSLEGGIEWSLDNYTNGDDFVETIYGPVKFEDLFEFYDDAKFVADNYCIRTERFEPPLWDEIKGGVRYKFILPNNGCFSYIGTISASKTFVGIVGAFYDLEFVYFDYSREGYKEAVEFAKKLFQEGMKDEKH